MSVNRFILVSSILVNGAAMGQLPNPADIFLNVFGLTLVAKLQAKQYIRKSGTNYTIVTPGAWETILQQGMLSWSQSYCPHSWLLDLFTLCSFTVQKINFVYQDTLYEGSISRDQVSEVGVEA